VTKHDLAVVVVDVLAEPQAGRRRSRVPRRRRPRGLHQGDHAGACGFTVEQLVELVRSGLATAVPGKVKTGGQTMEVTRLQIAKEGWKALGNEQWRG
jgi:hypothetical protein